MKLTSAEVIARITLAASRLGITLSASTSPIKMGVELGHFLIEKFFDNNVELLDGVGSIDGMLIEFFKTRTDNAAVSEDAVLAFYKALAEQPWVSEDAVFDFYKALADSAAASEAHALAVGKSLGEFVAGAEDHTVIFTKKVKEDTAAVAEAEFYAFGKAITEAPTLLTDDDTLAFFKNTQDTAGFTDDETLAFAKYLVDSVGVTDDIDGAASILDDQEMSFFKNMTHVATVTDTFFRAVSFYRQFSDTTAISDGDVLAVGKNVSDVAGLTHTEFFDIGKPLSDTPRVLEQIALSVMLAPFTDSFGITDSSFLTPGLGKSDLASTTDTGSLRSQGYCDFTYLAEDYVGASRTF